MKKFTKQFLVFLTLIFAANLTNAQGISDLLGGIFGGNSNSSSSRSAGGSGVLGNLLEGVFSSSDITVNDMVGVWTSNGPAVCFQSDNFLKKAGGVAAASMIEKELASYYQQYGLNGAVVTINPDATFSIKLKHLTLKGSITPDSSQKGVFNFTFTALGAIRLGSIKTYAQKSFNTMNLMFDATKLKQLISAVASLTGIKLAKTLSTLLDSYEGLCVGFRLDRTGNAPGQGNVNSGGSSAITDILGNIFGGSDSTTTTPASSPSQPSTPSVPSDSNSGKDPNQNTNSGSTGLGTLLDILNGGKSSSGSNSRK